MIVKQIQISNKLGLHTRAASKLVQTASRFQSDIKIARNGMTVDAKSIMDIMLLAAPYQAWLEFTFSGEDEDTALTEVESLIMMRFGEDK
jgi:phosphocarrier protein HPr